MVRFSTATTEGNVTEESGYHQCRQCSCRKTTAKGAYRDVVVELEDGRTVYFYHQHPVVIEHNDGRIELSSCGYQTSTTKERINRHIPNEYYVYQKDFTWYLEKPNGESIEFEDGMIIEP